MDRRSNAILCRSYHVLNRIPRSHCSQRVQNMLVLFSGPVYSPITDARSLPKQFPDLIASIVNGPRSDTFRPPTRIVPDLSSVDVTEECCETTQLVGLLTKLFQP